MKWLLILAYIGDVAERNKRETRDYIARQMKGY